MCVYARVYTRLCVRQFVCVCVCACVCASSNSSMAITSAHFETIPEYQTCTGSFLC